MTIFVNVIEIALDNFSDGGLIKRIATCLKIIISHFECSCGHIFLLRNKNFAIHCRIT